MPTVMIGSALGFSRTWWASRLGRYLLFPPHTRRRRAGDRVRRDGRRGSGVLWFTPTGRVFMGDVGALALGAVLGTIA